MNPALIARMQAPGPKKLLALDGGGIRGMMTTTRNYRPRAWARSGCPTSSRKTCRSLIPLSTSAICSGWARRLHRK